MPELLPKQPPKQLRSQEHITNAINYTVFAFFLADLGLNVVSRGFLLTPNAYMHVRGPLLPAALPPWNAATIL